MRILLVNPPYYRLFKDSYTVTTYPLSLGYLASAIKKQTKWAITVYNSDFAFPAEPWQVGYLAGEGFEKFRVNQTDISHPVWKEVKGVLEETRPEVIGIYCCSSNSSSAAFLANMAKTINKNTTVILGGPHPSAIGQKSMRDANVDIVVKGEGEQTIVELLNKIENNEELKEVEGIIHRTSNGIVETPNRELMDDLDSLEFPVKYAREVLRDYEKYPVSAFKSVLTSRGCPYNCFFCGSRTIFGRKTRFRSVENVIAEVKYLQKMGVKRFNFIDDSFGLKRAYLIDLCNSLIKECPDIRWECETGVNLVDEDTIKLMKKAGCCQIHMGVESGNNSILREMRKEITIEEAIAVADMLDRNGVKLRANFLIGIPTETEQTLEDTFRAMKRIKGRLGYSIFTPYPGTEAFEQSTKMHLISNDFDASLYNHQSPENCFCANIDKERFRAIAAEMEKYVDKRNAKQDFREFLSYETLSKAFSSNFLQDMESFKDFVKKATFEMKTTIKNLVTS